LNRPSGLPVSVGVGTDTYRRLNFDPSRNP
jgi:hypothetical protein